MRFLIVTHDMKAIYVDLERLFFLTVIIYNLLENMPVIKPPGEGRKARARQRRSQQEGDLLNAPFLHGNTTAGRWRQLDLVLLQLLPHSGLAVDIGMGEVPTTTLEFAQTLGDSWEVIGTECHLERLERTKQQNNARNVKMIATGLDFKIPCNQPNIIRALNVFRDYCLQDACSSIHKLCLQLPEVGILVEGSASKKGDTWSALVANCNSEIETVLFGTSKQEVQMEEIESSRIWRNECLDMPYAKHIKHLISTWRIFEHLPFDTCIQNLSEELSTVYCNWAHLRVIAWKPNTSMSVPSIDDIRVKRDKDTENAF